MCFQCVCFGGRGNVHSHRLLKFQAVLAGFTRSDGPIDMFFQEENKTFANHLQAFLRNVPLLRLGLLYESVDRGAASSCLDDNGHLGMRMVGSVSVIGRKIAEKVFQGLIKILNDFASFWCFFAGTVHQFEPTSTATQTWMYSLYSEILCPLTRSNLYYPWVQQGIDLAETNDGSSLFARSASCMTMQVMLIGLAGCGKTQSCTGLLKKLNPEACRLKLRTGVEVGGYRLRIHQPGSRVLLLKYKLRWGPTTVAVFDIKTINAGKSKVFSHW